MVIIHKFIMFVCTDKEKGERERDKKRAQNHSETLCFPVAFQCSLRLHNGNNVGRERLVINLSLSH